MNGFTRLLRDDSGASTVEYALVLALLAMATITALTALSGAITSRLQSLSSQLAAAASS